MMSALIALTLSACASSSPPPREALDEQGRKSGPQPVNPLQGGRHLTFARKIETDKGCEDATPAYRAIAALGEGFEVAQAELGECLLTMTGASEVETALFQQEGIFWLERASFAGEARAQRMLSEALGSRPEREHKLRALSWSLVYSNNADTGLYGYKPLHPSFISELKSGLTAEEIKQAEEFSADFSIIRMSQYRTTVSSERSRARQQQLEGKKRQRPGRISAR